MIHSFADINGRTVRLLMDLLLMQGGFLPAIIKVEDKLEYISFISNAELRGDYFDYYNIIFKAVECYLDLYLK